MCGNYVFGTEGLKSNQLNAAALLFNAENTELEIAINLMLL
jgi:hypothetical protein